MSAKLPIKLTVQGMNHKDALLQGGVGVVAGIAVKETQIDPLVPILVGLAGAAVAPRYTPLALGFVGGYILSLFTGIGFSSIKLPSAPPSQPVNPGIRL